MATTTARNKQDVNSMERADRIWDSLNYSYGKKRESSDEAYDKAISQADRHALSRGMQRSSYNNQVLGNLGSQKVKAQNDIWDAQIADYENRLQQIEENEAARAFQTSEREAQQAWQSEENEKSRAFTTAEREAQQNWQTGENELSRAWQSNESELSRAWQTAENDKSREYQKYRDAVSDSQWERQFGYTEKTAAQQVAMQYVMAAIEKGNVPSDELLAQAGLSRADAELMAKENSGGGTGGTRNPKATEDEQNPKGVTDNSFLSTLSSIFGGGHNEISKYITGIKYGDVSSKNKTDNFETYVKNNWDMDEYKSTKMPK